MMRSSATFIMVSVLVLGVSHTCGAVDAVLDISDDQVAFGILWWSDPVPVNKLYGIGEPEAFRFTFADDKYLKLYRFSDELGEKSTIESFHLALLNSSTTPDIDVSVRGYLADVDGNDIWSSAAYDFAVDQWACDAQTAE